MGRGGWLGDGEQLHAPAMILRAAAEPRRRYIERTDYESYVSPGEVITAYASDCIRGHGTFVRRGRVVASISGTVEWMDRLVTVRPLHNRYVASTAAIGDIVVGRVTEVVLGRGQRWKLDVRSQQDAHLLLSAINIAGSARERKWTEDHADLEMRSYFVEGDLVVAEVQKVYEDVSPRTSGPTACA